MFVHEHQLRHILTPADYHDRPQYKRELDCLFHPAWHPVATLGELARPGDFRTLDLLGQPLLIRNMDGGIHTFLNVCAHRHCMLTSQARGHDERLRCQYHGWEYDKSGHTHRIPDARCFRPFDRQTAHLRKFRTELCGEVIFVSLADDSPGLRAFLGPYYDYCRTSFAAPWRLNWAWETNYQANWKIPIENSLESYHIPCLHAKTFGTFPQEKDCFHDLNPSYSTFRTPEPDNVATRVQAWLVRRLGLPLTRTYSHHIAYPHLTITALDVIRLLQVMLPTSPTTCLHRVWLFVPGSRGWNPWTAGLARSLSWAGKLITRRIIHEDAAIFARVQRGIEASTFPGVIGTREERVFAFQEYVRRACREETVPERFSLDGMHHLP